MVIVSFGLGGAELLGAELDAFALPLGLSLFALVIAIRVWSRSGSGFPTPEPALEPWEKRCHALADVLDYHKMISTEEKRRGVESLGAEMVGQLTYYERWIVTFANILFQKAILTPDELARKMEEVSARHPAESAQ